MPPTIFTLALSNAVLPFKRKRYVLILIIRIKQNRNRTCPISRTLRLKSDQFELPQLVPNRLYLRQAFYPKEIVYYL